MCKFLTVERITLVGIEDANSVVERTKEKRESVLGPRAYRRE